MNSKCKLFGHVPDLTIIDTTVQDVHFTQCISCSCELAIYTQDYEIDDIWEN